MKIRSGRGSSTLKNFEKQADLALRSIKSSVFCGQSMKIEGRNIVVTLELYHIDHGGRFSIGLLSLCLSLVVLQILSAYHN